MDNTQGLPRKWKHKVIWAICDRLVDEGFRPGDITDSKLVETLKADGHAAGNPNQRLKYLREWKLKQLSPDLEKLQDTPLVKEAKRLEHLTQNRIDTLKTSLVDEHEEQINSYIKEIQQLSTRLSDTTEECERLEKRNEVLDESLTATAHQLGELRDKTRGYEYTHEALEKECKQSQIQLKQSQAQYQNVELLLQKLTDAHDTILREKTRALKENHGQENKVLSMKLATLAQDHTFKSERLDVVEEEHSTLSKKYHAIKEDADNWEGEKKRLTIELAKARTKQFLNEFSQFGQAFQSFTSTYVKDSQKQTQGYVNQCFERMYALIQFEFKKAGGSEGYHESASLAPSEGEIPGDPE